MRDSFVFYRSFYEAINNLENGDRLAAYDAIVSYALNEKTETIKGAAKSIFILTKPLIDANNKKYENGKKGGRPKLNKNQTITKVKPKVNQKITEVEPNDNMLNDNMYHDNENVKCKMLNVNDSYTLDYQSIVKVWNDFAGSVGLSKVKSLTEKRKKAIKSRSKEKAFVIQDVFDSIKESNFLLGNSKTGWRADFDFVFCSPNNYVKIIEGVYKNKDGMDFVKEMIDGL